VGYQHIDVDACTVRGIKVANTAGANTISVAEHTIAWGLCLLKNMFHAHTSTKLGGWEQMSIKPAELRGKVWGYSGVWTYRSGRLQKAETIQLNRIITMTFIEPEHHLIEQGTRVLNTLRMTTILSQSDVISSSCTPQRMQPAP